MSLLMKALKNAERPPQSPASGNGPDWSLQPMEAGAAASGVPPRTAQAAADLIRAREAASEGARLAILLGILVLVVAGMGGYFYIAVYMPWLLLPKPAVVAPANPVSPAAPIVEAASAPVLLSPPPVPAAPEVAPAMAVSPPSAGVRKSVPVEEAAVTSAETIKAVRLAPAAAPVVSDAMLAAYELLQKGRYDQARQAYEKLRMAQPANVDVVLGLAVIAQHQNRGDEAAQLYLRALELEPRNAFAQAGLIDLVGRADPSAAETRLRQLIKQQPAAYLHFALGNVLSGQGRWSDAQAAYFEAQRLEPDSADYAFNLAVSLEHIAQPRAAADYYRRALQLAQDKAAYSFDPAQARSRLQALSRQ